MIPGAGVHAFHSARWVPSKFSGLVASFHFDDHQTAVYVSGAQAGYVPRIGDSSGNGHTILTNANSNAPIYDANGMGPGVGGLLFSSSRTTLLYDSATFASASWAFLHDGTGCTIITYTRPSSTGSRQNVVSTTNSTSQTGINVYFNGSGSFWGAEVRNASTQILNLTGALGSSPMSQSYVTVFTYKEGLTPEATLRINGTVIATGNTTGAPNTNAVNTLALGKYQGFTGMFDGGMKHVLFYNRVLSTAEISRIESNIPKLNPTRQPRYVWTIGDSITSPLLWQQQLWVRHLTDSKYRIDFLGSRVAGEIAQFTDRQCNAVAGLTISGLITETNNVVLDNEPTDIMVMIGTNNAGNDLTATMTLYDSLITQLKTQHPTVQRIWVLRPPRRVSGTGGSTAAQIQWTEDYAALLQTYASTHDRCIYVNSDVDQASDLNADGIHPTAAGQIIIGNKIATAWGI